MADFNFSSHAAFIWSVADLLRGDYKQSDYGKVILPFTVLRRLDCVLEPTKAAVLAEKATREKAGLNPQPFLLRTSDELAKSGLLYLVTEKSATIDLPPAVVSNAQMGAVFEELIRKFAELSNETAGEHFTPREVIALMGNLLFIEDA